MKVYLAAASDEIELAEVWRDKLKAAGHTITYDWMALVREKGGGNPRTASHEDRASWARNDLVGAATSHVFWLLLPTGAPSAGSWFEFGFVYALIIRGGVIRPESIIVSGADMNRSIFTACADLTFDTHEAAFEGAFAK